MGAAGEVGWARGRPFFVAGAPTCLTGSILARQNGTGGTVKFGGALEEVQHAGPGCSPPQSEYARSRAMAWARKAHGRLGPWTFFVRPRRTLPKWPHPLARATECSISRLHVVRMRGGVTT